MSLGDLFGWCADLCGAIFEWHLDRPWFISAPLIVAEWVVLLVVVASPFVWFDEAHPCIAYSEPRYHAPTYVMSGGGKYGGGVAIPTGGGTYPDCLKRS